jgi:type I restriction enzyme S subunit
MRSEATVLPAQPDSWSECDLYGLAQWQNGLAFGANHFSGDGMPVIKIAELKNGVTSQTKRTAQQFGDEIRVTARDILFAWSGSPETSIDTFRWSGPTGWLNQHIFKVSAAPGVDQDFLFALLRGLRPRFISIAKDKQTTGLGHVTVQDLRALHVHIPPIDEQRRIAGVVGALDDKIEHNRKVRDRLRTLARSRLAHELEVGADRWDEAPLGDVFDIAIGGTWGADSNDGSLVAARVLRGIDVHELAEGALPELRVRYVKPAHLKKRLMQVGDVLVEASGSFCGRSVMVHESWKEIAEEPLTYSNFCKRLVPRQHVTIAAVAWLQLTMAYDAGEVSLYRTGSAFPNLDVAGLLASLLVRIPPEAEAEELARWINLSLDIRLALESGRLATIRDALLPKLVSGQIRVPESYAA